MAEAVISVCLNVTVLNSQILIWIACVFVISCVSDGVCVSVLPFYLSLLSFLPSLSLVQPWVQCPVPQVYELVSSVMK